MEKPDRQYSECNANAASQENKSQTELEAIKSPNLDTKDSTNHSPDCYAKKNPAENPGVLTRVIKGTKLTDVIMAIATVIIAVATGIYTHYAGKQWEVMTGQLGQMKSSSIQTDNLITETKNLAEHAGKQADNAATLASVAKDQVRQLETLVDAANKQNGAMNRQLAIMQKQLEVTDRPWIGVDVSIKDKIMFSDWNEARGINVTLSFSLKNYGASPARNITIVSQIRPHPGNTRARELDEPQDKMCAEARIRATERPISGVTTFPNDTKIEELGVGISGGGIYKTDEKILFSVLGCVDYTYANEQHGHTAFRMLLGGQPERGQWAGLPFRIGNDSAYTKRWENFPVQVGTTDSFMFQADPNGGNYAE